MLGLVLQLGTPFNERRQWDGGTLNLVVGTARTSLLNNVDKTSDANKPVSTAQAAADTILSKRHNADGLVVGLWDDREEITALYKCISICWRVRCRRCNS
jgi:hypothetical protein